MNKEFLTRTMNTGNQIYFDAAENDAQIQYEQYLKPHFGNLDSLNVLEIAFGWGRISSQLLQNHKVNSLTLVDINPINVAYVKKRFQKNKNVYPMVNNGLDLQEIETGIMDFVYSFDSMVHFNHELMAGYISEIKRVLKPGGKCFLHFSNHGKDCNTEHLGTGLRGDMTNEAMLQLVNDCAVIHNEVIDWAGAKDLDAIILFEK